MRLKIEDIRNIVAAALEEDIGTGDLTTESLFPPDCACRAFIVAEDDGIIAGLGVARQVFRALDAKSDFKQEVTDGARVAGGSIIARVAGATRAVLAGERTALNFLGRMSGIATLTGRFVDRVSGYRVKIMDTRKTSPGLRTFEKYAVAAGGGFNHRMGLFDAVLIKDNHIKALNGSIAGLVKKARGRVPIHVKIEVEVSGLRELEDALAGEPDIIMLDNMNIEKVGDAVKLIRRRPCACLIEVSGGITIENAAQYAACGVDIISIGALTHSAPALNLSLEVEKS